MQETHYTITGCPVSIALLADSHNRASKRVLASLRSHKPDIIAIVGDFVQGAVPKHGTKWEESNNARWLLSGCAEVAPTFVSLGNHEWILNAADLREVEATGCVLLDDRWIEVGPLAIGGFTSARVGEYRAWRETQPALPQYPRMPAGQQSVSLMPDGSRLEGFFNAGSYRILLCHHPEYWQYLKDRDVHLVLSGHAHGGQWRYYSWRAHEWRGVFSPSQGLWPRLTSGVHDGRLVVSRGLSNTAPVPRICNPTEVVYIN